MTSLSRRIDLIRAGEKLIRLMQTPDATLRVIRGGFRYASDALTFDLTRYGIVLRKAAMLPLARQAEILAAIAAIAEDLGFAISGNGEEQSLPLPGGAFAIHPALAALDARITEDMKVEPPDEPGDGFDVGP